MKIISGNLNEVLEQLNKAKTRQVVLGGNIDFNRKILEHKKTAELILNHKIGKDKLYERDSGLNHILCKIARDNDIILAIDLSEITKERTNQENKREKAITLSRIIQNIKLIKKYKNKLKVIGIGKREAQDILLVLSLPTNMLKNMSRIQ